LGKLAKNNDVKQYVVFEIEGEIYALDILFVESIERMSQITRVPYSPAEMLGVINLRGDVIPVASIRQVLGYGEQHYTEATRIIIVQYEDYRIGMVVDRVLEILTVPFDSIQWGIEALEDKRKGYFSGIINLEDKPIMVLDIPRTLNLSN
jgi:purine-binding chemotaxis protein CheW